MEALKSKKQVEQERNKFIVIGCIASFLIFMIFVLIGYGLKQSLTTTTTHSEITLFSFTEIHYPKWAADEYVYIGHIDEGLNATERINNFIAKNLGKDYYPNGVKSTIKHILCDPKLEGTDLDGIEIPKTVPFFAGE